MSDAPMVRAPSEWPVALDIRPRLRALLDAESRHSGRSVNEILIEAIQDFLRAHPISFR